MKMNDFSIENYKQLSDKQKRELLTDRYFLFNKVISKYLTGHRYYHSISTAITASELAYAHHYPVNKAYVAGILHDITKQWSKEQSIEWLERFEPEYLNKAPAIWHPITAYYYLKEYTDLDKEILIAIRNHTVPESDDLLTMIIYLADKLERTRSFRDNDLYLLAKTDIHRAFTILFEKEQNKHGN